MAKLVSKTYGDALFELALEKQTIDTVFEEIKEVKEVFTENEELMKLLNHPKITKEEKVKIIENIFKGRVSDDVTGFLVIIVEKGRYNSFDAIFDYFIAAVKEYKKIGIAKVTSAVELSDEQKKKVEEKLLQTTIYTSFEMNYHVDKSLIGGLIIRIGDRVVDSSIKTKLDKLARNLQKIQLSTC
ncbi:MAG: ATP synthase F1 subunit delta [Lachnospiraceae bacterium]|nr:ATP synthase F1 subunit delta [Lachnospiraceae bacterium]